ncbi:MAG: TIGR04053 family radical SAM/SPASM domain-containing protein [Candidatus Dadabacteria bacterium]|nr:MAG: TIGR04053 family radical SAM/SPASM domain-containing protein [Candidatus Dadabacteria bacterium]
MGSIDFDQRPFLVIWETTQACDLACKHCRAEAIPNRDPRELTTDEGKALLEEVARMGTPIFILSGGDPLRRPDLEELIRHGKTLGLRMGTIPAATPALTRERIRALADAGVDQVAFSLDGPTERIHDTFRGVEGSFAKTLEGVEFAHEAGIPVQINTCFASWNFAYLEAMVDLVKRLGVVFWEVFFLVPTGRGREMESLTAEQFEQAFERLHRLNSEAPFIIKVTEAPHYRRYVIEKEMAQHAATAQERIEYILARPRGIAGIGMSPKAVNSGKGFAFVSHIGEIYPSGFLPLCAGNVRTDSLADVYRNSPLFRRLRDPNALGGKCRACAYADVCGGSRARAYALTGDYMAAEPFCAYTP